MAGARALMWSGALLGLAGAVFLALWYAGVSQEWPPAVGEIGPCHAGSGTFNPVVPCTEEDRQGLVLVLRWVPLIIAGVGALLVGLGMSLRREAHKSARIEAHGVDGRATVLAVKPLSVDYYERASFKMRLRLDDLVPPREVDARVDLTFAPAVGECLRVRHLPDDPTQIAVTGRLEA